MFALRIRTFFLIAFAAWASTCLGADLHLLSAKQMRPGTVAVDIAFAGPDLPKAEDFSLLLGDAEPIHAAELRVLPSSTESRALLIYIDTSGSMGPSAVKAIQTALNNVITAEARPAVLPFSVAIRTFSSRSDVLLPFSNDKAAVASAIRRITPDTNPSGKTRLYDALLEGLPSVLGESAASKHLIVITDGADDGSQHSLEEVLGAVKSHSSAIALDTIAFGSLAASHEVMLETVAGKSAIGQFKNAGTDERELAQALEALTRLALTAKNIELMFQYVADTAGTPADEPMVAYLAETGMPIKGDIVAPAKPVQEGKTWTEILLDNIYWVIGAAAALLLIVLLYFLLRSRFVKPALPPRASGASWSPGGDSRPAEPEQATVATPSPRAKHTMVAYLWPLPGSGQPVALLHGLSGSARGRQFTIDKAVVRIGAETDNDIVLDGDGYVSGHHASIRAEAHALYLVDMSRNGSVLNGQTFKGATQALTPGDEIRFGNTSLEVVAAGGRARRSGSEYEPIVP